MNSSKLIELKPLIDPVKEWEEIEKRIKELFRKEIYFPLLSELSLPKSALKNALDESNPLVVALRSGRVSYQSGAFYGRFNAAISKELKELGAVWIRKSASWKIPLSLIPPELRVLLYSTLRSFIEKIAGIDDKLAQMLPEEIAGKIKLADIFDRTLWKVDQSFEQSIRNITVAPQLTPHRRKVIADEWQNNMELWIKNFTKKEIVKLRKEMQTAIFAGNRYESVVESIQDSYGVSARKAKFLARQETSLLISKFKEVRYKDAGVNEYKWRCVLGTKLHPVRPRHKQLAEESNAGKIFTWDNPPVTSEPGTPERRNNPKEDYNCRCTAVPIVRARKG